MTTATISTAPKVAIVNEAFAQQDFRRRRIRWAVRSASRVRPGKPDPVYQVVGMVRNTKYYELREDFKPIGFLPIAQDETRAPEPPMFCEPTRPWVEFYGPRPRRLAEVNPGFGIHFTVLTTQLKESLLRERLMAALAGAFGILAGALAVLGLYGVIAYMVARRRNEIGVRIALGAGRGRVIGLVLKEAAVLLGIGLAVGVGLALWAAQGGNFDALRFEAIRSGDTRGSRCIARDGGIGGELRAGVPRIAARSNGGVEGRVGAAARHHYGWA